MPSIDRKPWGRRSRSEKLTLERRSIDLFRSTARFFASAGEQGALTDDIVALMVLRHYHVPTRLLDWSRSPHIAAYFSVCDHDAKEGEIWSFDEPLYEEVGRQQWKQWPETTSDGSGDPSKFDAGLTAFSAQEPRDWICCGFYRGFPRQDAQAGAYTLTARFDRSHAEMISNLLRRRDHYHLYVVDKDLKPALRRILQEKHGVWRGSLYPDTAGAADTVCRVVFSQKSTPTEQTNLPEERAKCAE
jgi:hypothetical protein